MKRVGNILLSRMGTQLSSQDGFGCGPVCIAAILSQSWINCTLTPIIANDSGPLHLCEKPVYEPTHVLANACTCPCLSWGQVQTCSTLKVVCCFCNDNAPGCKPAGAGARVGLPSATQMAPPGAMSHRLFCRWTCRSKAAAGLPALLASISFKLLLLLSQGVPGWPSRLAAFLASKFSCHRLLPELIVGCCVPAGRALTGPGRN